MSTLTKSEIKVLLMLFKDFSSDYNANSLSKQCGITPRGTLTILKNLEKKNLLISKQLGKAVFYKLKLHDYYAFRTLETLLISEAREKASRWLWEFEDLFKSVEIVILFGSVIRKPKEANDVDLLLVFTQEKMSSVKKFIQGKNQILLKPIHPIMQSPDDIFNNMKKRDPVVLSALRYGYVLHGYDKLIEVMKNVTGF